MYALVHVTPDCGYRAAIMLTEDDRDLASMPPTRPELEEHIQFGVLFLSCLFGGGGLVLPLPAHAGHRG